MSPCPSLLFSDAKVLSVDPATGSLTGILPKPLLKPVALPPPPIVTGKHVMGI